MLTSLGPSPVRCFAHLPQLIGGFSPALCRSFATSHPVRCIASHRGIYRRSHSVTVRAAKLATVAETCNDSRALLLPLIALASLPSSAVAADSITYAPGGGADVVKIVAGLAYVGLLAFWLFKVIGRRIKRSTTERLASERNLDAEDEPADDETKEVSAGAAALGALQASFFTYLLYLFSTSISNYFGQQGLPDQYTARNITVTIRTAVGGLAYLATFIFGANALGLAGLTLKLAFFPDTAEGGSKGAAEASKDDSAL